MVTGGAAEGDCDVGVAVLAVDADPVLSRRTAHLKISQRPWGRGPPGTLGSERFQRCRSRVRTAAAIDVIRFGLHRDLRKIRHDFSRAMPRSTGARAADSARLTVCWVGVRSRPGGRLRAVVTHGPAPM